ncbi:four helix bundle protein [Candidatus Nomurabacteria bacterium]|nr:four helix bundle protein [Candidatus Nomurabacteria bacterium]
MPIINHTLSVYKIWHEYKNNFPKNLRYTLVDKIDSIFINLLEYLFVATYQNKEEKLPTILLALRKTDLLKFFLRVSWEIHALDNKKYIEISEKLAEVGRMLGGWKKGLESKTPPK